MSRPTQFQVLVIGRANSPNNETLPEKIVLFLQSAHNLEGVELSRVLKHTQGSSLSLSNSIYHLY